VAYRYEQGASDGQVFIFIGWYKKVTFLCGPHREVKVYTNCVA
jgi:hypothetical protein